MNPEDLRKSLIEEVKNKEAEADIALEKEEELKLRFRVIEEARKVQIRWRGIAPGAERRKLKEIYEAMDVLVTAMKDAAELEDSDESKGRRKKLTKKAGGLIETARKLTGRPESLNETIEKGRRNVVESSAAGAGANTQKRIRDELNYLIDHYSPSNDNKIETLIDKWRRSGDPDYDPAIRLRFRKARKKKSGEEYAL